MDWGIEGLENDRFWRERGESYEGHLVALFQNLHYPWVWDFLVHLSTALSKQPPIALKQEGGSYFWKGGLDYFPFDYPSWNLMKTFSY